jgi:hypothetical protein
MAERQQVLGFLDWQGVGSASLSIVELRMDLDSYSAIESRDSPSEFLKSRVATDEEASSGESTPEMSKISEY